MFGVTALEAPLFDTPVLMSKQSGASEALQNALKIDHWDIDGIANQITSALASPGLLQTLTENSREEVMQMGWHKAADQITHNYRGVLA